MENINISIDELNNNMHEFLDNRNKLARINIDLVNEFGKEYYLSELSDTLVSAFNTFEKFYPIVEKKEEFAYKLKKVSVEAVNFFTIDTKESLGKMRDGKKRRILDKKKKENVEKLNALLKALDEVNLLIEPQKDK